MQVREVTCKINNSIQNSLTAEFGLGKYNTIDTVEVRWPSGIIDVLTNLQINQLLTIKEGYGDSSVPQEYQLLHNYPNPFNSSTLIQYTVGVDPHQPDRSLEVQMTTYNVLGQKIKTLVNETKMAGHYSIKWNGKDERNINVASGVYIYQLKTDKFIETQKMLLLR